MAGHSAFKNIMHKKGRADAARAKMFAKLEREITVAAKMGSPDPGMNPRLRLAIQAARAENMPKDNIERAIKKGTGELEGVNYEEVMYEGYAPGGVAVMARCLTDNTNRTVSEVNKIYSKNGGNMGVPGCVSFMFETKGYFYLPLEGNPGKTEDEMMEIVLEAGAEDLKTIEDGFEIYSAPSEFFAVRQVLDEKRLKVEEAKVMAVPKTTVKVTGADVAKVLKLVDALEEHDDVQDVYYNYEISDEDMEMALSAS